MEIWSSERAVMCAIRPRRAASRPNTAAGDGVWATFEVACYGLRVTHDLALYSRSDLNQFVRDLSLFAANRTGEVLLRTARPDLAPLRDALPLWHASQLEAPPARQATLRIFELDQARHVALTASFVHRREVQSTPVEDSLVVTFELDPSSLVRHAAELDDDLAQL